MHGLNENLEAFIDLIEDLSDYKLRVSTVANRLDCSVRTVYRLIESDELDAIKKTPHNTRISEESFVRYMKKCKNL